MRDFRASLTSEQTSYANHRRMIWANYGLRPEDYASLLASQDGLCWFCRRATTGRRLAVDHDHSNGTVRGLLCNRCNTSLGWYEKYAARIPEYLESTSNSQQAA